MKPTDLNSMTKADLLKLAKKLKLPTDSKQLKKALVKSIQNRLKQPGASSRSAGTGKKTRAGGAGPKASRREVSEPERASRPVSKPKTNKAGKKKISSEKAASSAEPAQKKTGAKPAHGKRRARIDTGKKAKSKQAAASTGRRGRSRGAASVRPPVHLEKAPGGLEAKYLVASPQAQDEDRGLRPPDLPAGYGSPCLVLLPRDPQWVFGYWEIPPDAAHELLAQLGESWDRVRWVLRLYSPARDQVRDIAPFDVDIDPFALGWYLRLTPPGASFQAEIGLRAGKARFAVLACSNIVTLPTDRPSNVLDEEWRLTATDEDTHYGAYPLSDKARQEITGPTPSQRPGGVFSRPNPFDSR